MSENVEANIKQILDTFNLFIVTYEEDVWLKNVSTEGIKNAFKLAAFVEKTVCTFEQKDLLQQFMSALKDNRKSNGMRFEYPVEFLKTSCDHVLEKFLITRLVPVKSADIALRIYTSMMPKERLENTITELILKNSSYDAIMDFMCDNEKVNTNELEPRLLLNSLLNETDIQEAINNMLSGIRVLKTLPLFLSILKLKNFNSNENDVKDQIVDVLQIKMLDRSALSKNLWWAFFKNVDLVSICLQYEGIFNSLMNFIIYVGSMMKCERDDLKKNWISDSQASLCLEITYEELCTFIRNLACADLMAKSRVLEKISGAVKDTGLFVWSQVLEDVDV